VRREKSRASGGERKDGLEELRQLCWSERGQSLEEGMHDPDRLSDLMLIASLEIRDRSTHSCMPDLIERQSQLSEGGSWRMTHLYARVLKPLLEELQRASDLEVEDNNWASGEDSERALARTSVCLVDHGERLDLEGMPWSPLVHGPVRDVDDGVDCLVTNDGCSLVCNGVEENLLDGGERGCGELVVERKRLSALRAER
jgi:hypothetical protein